jgi:hypothetical protein
MKLACVQDMSSVYFCYVYFQLWKRSGAWFFKGIPKYVVPTNKKPEAQVAPSYRHSPSARSEPKVHMHPAQAGRTYNTWSKGGTTRKSMKIKLRHAFCQRNSS